MLDRFTILGMAQRTASTGRFLALDRARVEQTVKDMEPVTERAATYVVVNGRRYGARKVFSAATGTSLNQVSAALALSSLGRLGFITGERRRGRSRALGAKRPTRAQRRDSDLDQQLRKHIGEWVAVRDGELLVAAPDAKTVIAWLKERADSAEAMYKVPRDLTEISGAAA